MTRVFTRGHILERVSWVAWVLLLLSIPVTSFPFFPFSVFEDALVRPLALYPLGVLLFSHLLPYLFTGKKMPQIVLPLLAFVIVVSLLLSLELLQPSVPFRDRTPFSRASRGIVSLAIGVSIYLVTATIARDRRRLEASMRWLYIALGIALCLSLVQISLIVFEMPSYERLNEFQRMFSLRNLRKGRVSGFAFEPSWFADQLVVLWIPFVLGGLISRSRILGRRRLGVLVEILLVVIALVALAFTYSRGGVVSLLFSVGLVLLIMLISKRQQIVNWLIAADDASKLLKSRLINITLRVSVLIVGLVGVLVGAGSIFSRSGYFSLVWERFWRLLDSGSIAQYLASIGADIRVALSLAGWEVFLRNPICGVGLGQSGFYLLDHLPSWTRERSALTADLFSQFSMDFPNPKNFWIRLLSETGLVGTTFFIVFMLVMLACAMYMAGKRDRLTRHIGLAGVISWLAIIVEGLSLDSFALPTMWIALGLVTSGIWLLRESDKKDNSELENDRA